MQIVSVHSELTCVTPEISGGFASESPGIVLKLIYLKNKYQINIVFLYQNADN